MIIISVDGYKPDFLLKLIKVHICGGVQKMAIALTSVFI
jgi:hypothetical protein